MPVATPPRTTKKPTAAQRRRRGIQNLTRGRALVQLAIATLIVVAAVRHQTKETGNPSVDALCPFGGVETLVTLITQGHFIAKTHPSNIVLALAVLAATLLVGNVFCGWICPFGAVQDALTWVRNRVGVKAWQPPARLDHGLRWGRFVVLGIVIYFSVATSKLWFANYDPYVQLFGLHWIFHPSEVTPVALTILGVVLAGSLVIDRFWCRYLCPPGAMFAVVGKFGFLRIRRSATTCTDCTLCDRTCPVGLDVSKSAPAVSSNCIGCLDCVATCPVKGALKLEGPVSLGSPTAKTPVSAGSKTGGAR